MDKKVLAISAVHGTAGFHVVEGARFDARGIKRSPIGKLDLLNRQLVRFKELVGNGNFLTIVQRDPQIIAIDDAECRLIGGRITEA